MFIKYHSVIGSTRFLGTRLEFKYETKIALSADSYHLKSTYLLTLNQNYLHKTNLMS